MLLRLLYWRIGISTTFTGFRVFRGLGFRVSMHHLKRKSWLWRGAQLTDVCSGLSWFRG